MSYLEDMGKAVGSRRYARDLASDDHVITKPWWDTPGEESREPVVTVSGSWRPVRSDVVSFTPAKLPIAWPFA